MQFLYPGFLWALFTISIPVIIHLFYFRRFKKVYFSNTRFLKEIKEETTNSNRLKELLILLSRILALIFLVLAFAQPFIPSDTQTKKGIPAVSIYIDNSFSMESNGEEVPQIDRAKKIAAEIIKAFPENSNFQILTNEISGQNIRWIDKKSAIEIIGQIALSPVKTSVSILSNRQIQSFENIKSSRKYSYWISDFQKSSFNIDTVPTDKSIQYNLVGLKSLKEKNISIDTCYWDKPMILNGYVNKLLVKLTNYSQDDAKDVPLNMSYEKEIMPLGKVNIKANSSLIDTIDLRIKYPKWNQAVISIKDYPVIFDDDYYISFNVPEKVKVLNVNENSKPNDFIYSAYRSSDYFDFKYSDLNKVEYSAFKSYQLIILEDVTTISSGLASSLIDALNFGANVILFPSPNADLGSINAFLSQIHAGTFSQFAKSDLEADKLNEKEIALKNVYEKSPSNISSIKTKSRYISNNFASNGRYDIIKFKNNESFLSRYKLGNGQFYLCSSPLSTEYSDFVKNPDIFAPLMFNIAIADIAPSKMSYTIGDDKIIRLDKIKLSNDKYIKVKGAGQEFIPKMVNSPTETILDEGNLINKASVYNLMKDDSIISKLAFNYDRKESSMDFYDVSDVSKKFGTEVKIYDNKNENYNFTKMINASNNGKSLWIWAIILSLLFLAIEIVLIRFWK